MASWLTSRLKAAELLLQQIDQQAAITKEQLGNPNADLTSLLTPDLLRGGRRVNNDQPPSRAETLSVPSLSGNGKGRDLKRSHPPIGSRNIGVGPEPANEDDFGKLDWTELLGSTDRNPPLSATRSSSSVGSIDFGGTQNVSRGGSLRGFHPAGKDFVSSHETNEFTPASKKGFNGAAPSHPSSVQGSRTQGPSKYMAVVSVSELHQKAGNHQEVSPKSSEDENVPRKLGYGAQVLEGSGEGDLNDYHMDALTHTNDADITADPFVQPENQDGEFSELELFVPEDTKYLKNTNLGVSARDSVIEGAPSLMLGQTTVPVDEIDGRDTSALGNSDVVSLADEEESQEIRMEADGTHQDVGDQEAALDKRGNAEETEVPRHIVQTVQGTDRHADDEGSDEDSGREEKCQNRSGSESDSEYEEYEERVRRRREKTKDLEERRIGKAAALEATRAAIRDREELVAILREEKENLEKILAEWDERQVKEAEELNVTMKEVSEAVEGERQRHAITRREGLAREAQLEAKSHELAKALAAAERKLEDESAGVAFVRNKVEAREIGQSDLQRKLLRLQYRLRPTPPHELQDSKTERETAEEHFAELIARHEQYQNKAKQLEENIFLARDAHYTPSLMELELESRLNQLTDQLIQKQSQVEALSTEKATLHFRLETISNTLRMEKSASQSRALKRSSIGANPATDWSTCNDDLEYGLSKPYSSKDKNFLIGTDPDTILNQTAGSELSRQVDSVFLMGARVLRTSGSARALAVFYTFLLHSWVLFIFFMHVRSGGSGSPSEVAGLQAVVNELSVLTHSLNSTASKQ